MAEPKPEVELRTYATFSEVRTRVQSHTEQLELTFPQGVWEHVVPSSLGLLDCPYTSVTHAEAPSWLKGLEGQRVSVRLDPLAPLREATLVRAADLLVQDDEGYYRVCEDQLVFHQPPREKTETAGRQVTFRLRVSGEGVLSYLTRGVRWKPRYTLDAEPDAGKAKLVALADVTNETAGLHVPDRLELIAGDVQMELEERASRAQSRMYAMAAPAPAYGGAPELEEVGELGGLYRYNVRNPPPLDPKSTVSVPFLPDAELQLEREARLETSFSHIGAQRGNFNRGYWLSATQNLPGGRLTIREGGRIVGQHDLPETPAGHPIRFTLGRDPDVTYVRSVRPLGVGRDPDGKGKVRRVSYEVTYSVTNHKKRQLEATIQERHYYSVVTLEGAEDALDNIALLSTPLGAGETKELSYRVTIDH